jgi:hypothetical protein
LEKLAERVPCQFAALVDSATLSYSQLYVGTEP